MKTKTAFKRLTLGVSITLAGIAVAGIEGSKHDFSNKDWSGGDSCTACHAPHRESAPKVAPLWDPKADLSRRFTSGKADRSLPQAGTLVCLRCHDGTVARDTISNVREERFVNRQNPGVFGTGHGPTDHPVGVEYPKIDKDYRPASSVEAGGVVRLPENRVECVSCHDPHNQSGEKYMLVTSNARSALCLSCHKK